MNKNYYLLQHKKPISFSANGRFGESDPGFFMGSYSSCENIGVTPVGNFSQDQINFVDQYFEDPYSYSYNEERRQESYQLQALKAETEKKAQEKAESEGTDWITRIGQAATGTIAGITEIGVTGLNAFLQLAPAGIAAYQLSQTIKDPVAREAVLSSQIALANGESAESIIKNAKEAESIIKQREDLAKEQKRKDDEIELRLLRESLHPTMVKESVRAANLAQGKSPNEGLGEGSGEGKILGMEKNTAIIVGAVAFAGVALFMMQKKN
jgi:hypothetical protein